MQARQVNQQDISCVYRSKVTRHEFNSTNYTINRPRQTSWVIIYLKKTNSGDFKQLIGSGKLGFIAWDDTNQNNGSTDHFTG